MHIGIAHLGEVRRRFTEVEAMQRQDSRIEEHTREEVGILISLWYFRLGTRQKMGVLASELTFTTKKLPSTSHVAKTMSVRNVNHPLQCNRGIIRTYISTHLCKSV
jgi:hypothetical protein